MRTLTKVGALGAICALLVIGLNAAAQPPQVPDTGQDLTMTRECAVNLQRAIRAEHAKNAGAGEVTNIAKRLATCINGVGEKTARDILAITDGEEDAAALVELLGPTLGYTIAAMYNLL